LRLKGWLFVVEKNTQEKRTNKVGGGRDKSSSPSHKLNITNGMTNKIILLVILSVILLVQKPRHCMIWLF
jgi:hypothetical protein